MIQVNWTRTDILNYCNQDLDLSNELYKQLSKLVAEEIDWEITSNLRQQLGWFKAKVNPDHDIDKIEEWTKLNCQGEVAHRGTDWQFNLEKDFVLFILTWA